MTQGKGPFIANALQGKLEAGQWFFRNSKSLQELRKFLSGFLIAVKFGKKMFKTLVKTYD